MDEICDICDGAFTLINGEIVPAVGTIVDENKYYIDVCDECIEKYNIDFFYTCIDNLFEQAEHIVGDDFPSPSIN